MQATAQLLLETIQDAYPKLQAISPEQASAKPVANKWSLNEILGHLIDSAANNHQRFVRMQQVVDLGKFGYDQNHWVTSQAYQDESWEDLVAFWYAYNRHLSHVIAHLPPGALQHHTDMGYEAPKTLQFVAEDYVRHVQHHLSQIFSDADPTQRTKWGYQP
ncbi:MAG: DinB family protein [Spirosomataceae bacterium]